MNETPRVQALALAARIPAIYGTREYPEVGGLMSYGPNLPDLYRRAAEFVDKILRGAKPADIPVEQPTKFDFIINLTTAKAGGGGGGARPEPTPFQTACNEEAVATGA